MKIFLFLLCFLVFFEGKLASNQYLRHQLWRIESGDKNLLEEAITTLHKDNFDVWSNGLNWVDVRVSPNQMAGLKKFLQRNNLNYRVNIEDIGSLINDKTFSSSSFSKVQFENRVFSHSKYNTLDEINAYLDELEVSASDVTVSTQIIGTTNGDDPTDMRMVTVSTSEITNKPAIWIDCGIHAREWISPATCMWIIDDLVSKYGIDPDITNLLDTYDFYILPSMNPEGYKFTWNTDRLWRKNRNNNNACPGVDLNRNSDANFGGVGASGSPCSETYHGEFAFSESETSAVRDVILNLVQTTTVKSFYSIHSYSQLWMYAYAYKNEIATDAAELDRVASIGVAALGAVHGTAYEYGNHFTVIYPASGTSLDWAYEGANITYSYLLELRDEGQYGFILPENQIIPTAEETWAGIVAALTAMA